MTNEQAALKDMYYLRMVNAESAIELFIKGSLTNEIANRVIENREKLVRKHLALFPDN